MCKARDLEIQLESKLIITVAEADGLAAGPGPEPDSEFKDDLLPQSPTFSESTNESTSESVISNNDLMREATNNHLILKEIFKHSSVKDLLQFSLVCKEWNLKSRTVLRENKLCVAKIRRYDLCQDLAKLNILLKHCVNAPFNGLALYNYSVSSVWMNHTCVKDASNNFMELFSTLLNKIPFKYLEIGWKDEKFCVAIPVLKRIFKDYATKLEGLSLFAIEETPSKSLAEYFEITKRTTTTVPVPTPTSSSRSWLPKLKFLEILF